MGGISGVREQIVELLGGDIRFDGVRVISEYSGSMRSLPVRQSTIAVGIERVEFIPAALGGYLGEASGLSHTSREFCGPFAEITLRFDCYRPQSEPFGSHFVESIYECLLPITGVSRIWCDPIRPETQALANHLRILATMRTLLAAGDEAPTIEQIILKRRNTSHANH